MDGRVDRRTMERTTGRLEKSADGLTNHLIRMMFQSIPSNAYLIADEILGNENMEMPYVSTKLKCPRFGGLDKNSKYLKFEQYRIRFFGVTKAYAIYVRKILRINQDRG